MSPIVMASFFHLPRQDIVFPLVFFLLDTVEVWNLRAVCREFLKLCEEYFAMFCPSISYNEQNYIILSKTDSLKCMRLVERDRMCVVRAQKISRKLKRLHLHLLPSSAYASTSGDSSGVFQRTCDSLVAVLWHTECELVSLRLTNVDCSSRAGIVSGFERLGEQCIALRELHIEAMPRFDDECLENLTRRCRSLVKVTLKTLPRIQGTCLERLGKGCPQLEELNVSGSYNIRTAHLERAIRACHHLKTLDLSSTFAVVTDSTILTVKEYCDRLQWLSIVQCSRVTELFLLPLEERGVSVEGRTGGTSKYRKIWGQI